MRKPEYLPHLDALRFWAFIAVFLAHSMHNPFGDSHGIIIWQEIKDFLQVGVLGVNFFFVLSGFLITRLLLYEREQCGHIHLLKFYIRRSLRIWPLYFLILLAVAIVYFIRVSDTNTQWWYYIFFLGNFHIINIGAPQSPALANLWTLGAEEQFYLLWPLLLLLVGRRSVHYLIGFVVGASLLFRYYYLSQAPNLYFHPLSICGDFAIGALGAWISLYYPQTCKKFFSKSALSRFLIYITLTICLIFYRSLFSFSWTIIIERLIFSLLFTSVLLDQIYSNQSLFKIGNSSTINYLGKISYGLYMYHAFALQISYHLLLPKSLINYPLVYMLVYPCLALCITVILSVFSYELLECRFLNLKKHFY